MMEVKKLHMMKAIAILPNGQMEKVKIIITIFCKRQKTPIEQAQLKKYIYIFILGDSMVKHVFGWEISNKLDYKHKVFVRSFSGAKTSCMSDYIKPCF